MAIAPRVDVLRIKPTDIPAPPQSSIALIRACDDANVAFEQLCQLVQASPSLSAELLRLVNSAWFQTPQKIDTVAKAIKLMGQRSLLNVVLCLTVKNLLQQDPESWKQTAVLWEDSVRRAAICRLLAQEVGVNPEEGFTAGLLQDFPFIMMFYVNPTMQQHVPGLRACDPDQRFDQEVSLFGMSHVQVAELVTIQWGLPDKLSECLVNHHEVLGHQASVNSKVLYCADWMCAVFAAAERGKVLEQCRSVLKEFLNLDAGSVNEILEQVPPQTERVAQMMGLKLPVQESFEDILRQANSQLAEANLTYQELMWELEAAIRQRDQLATELAQELELAREIQQSLLPAGDHCCVSGVNIPAKELSGDFFDFFSLEDGSVLFNMGDVSGKGVNAALLMAKTSSLFRCLGKQFGSLDQLMAVINREIVETSVRGMFVSMVAGRYHPQSDQLELVNAGSPPGIFFPMEGQVRVLAAQTPPLGISNSVEFHTTRMSLNGGVLYFFSDGFTETGDKESAMLGVEGVIKLIRTFSGLPATQRLQALIQRVQEGAEFATRLRDDMTIIVLENNCGS